MWFRAITQGLPGAVPAGLGRASISAPHRWPPPEPWAGLAAVPAAPFGFGDRVAAARGCERLPGAVPGDGLAAGCVPQTQRGGDGTPPEPAGPIRDAELGTDGNLAPRAGCRALAGPAEHPRRTVGAVSVCLPGWGVSHCTAPAPSGGSWGAQPPAGLPGKSGSAPRSLMLSDSALIVAIKAQVSARSRWCLSIAVGTPVPDLRRRGAASQPSPSQVYVPLWGGGDRGSCWRVYICCAGRNYSLVFRRCVQESRRSQAKLPTHLSKCSWFKVGSKHEKSREAISHRSSLNK